MLLFIDFFRYVSKIIFSRAKILKILHLSIFILVVSVLCTLGIPAFAQTAQDIDNATQQSQEFIQQEQLRQRELQQQRRALPDVDLGDEVDKQSDVSPAQTSCFAIDEINFEGATLLSEEETQDLKAPYIGTCVGLSEINTLIRAITNMYFSKGYITTRAYIPRQDLSKGTLKLFVVEGKVSSIAPENDTSGVNVKTAFPKVEGKVLNLNDIEQGVAQLNRLSSNRVQLDLKPGENPGETFVVIKNQPTRRINGSLSFDNTGSETTGDLQGGIVLNIDNVLNINERLFVSYRQNVENNSAITQESDSLSAGFSVPFGYWTISGNYSSFEYESLIEGAVEDFDTSGTSDVASLNVDWVFHRRKANLWTLSGGYTFKSNENFIEDALLTTSSGDLAIINTRLSHSRPLLGGELKRLFRH